MIQEKLLQEETGFFIDLLIPDNYPDFGYFYGCNKRKIYESIVEVFKELNRSGVECLKMRVIATVDSTEFSTCYSFKSDSPITLVRDILPYFVEMEEYEICGEIVKLHDSLVDKFNKLENSSH
jgi:hypothetical protein